MQCLLHAFKLTTFTWQLSETCSCYVLTGHITQKMTTANNMRTVTSVNSYSSLLCWMWATVMRQTFVTAEEVRPIHQVVVVNFPSLSAIRPITDIAFTLFFFMLWAIWADNLKGQRGRDEFINFWRVSSSSAAAPASNATFSRTSLIIYRIKWHLIFDTCVNEITIFHHLYKEFCSKYLFSTKQNKLHKHISV